MSEPSGEPLRERVALITEKVTQTFRYFSWIGQ
jgi:hypothetical protein